VNGFASFAPPSPCCRTNEGRPKAQHKSRQTTSSRMLYNKRFELASNGFASIEPRQQSLCHIYIADRIIEPSTDTLQTSQQNKTKIPQGTTEMQAVKDTVNGAAEKGEHRFVLYHLSASILDMILITSCDSVIATQSWPPPLSEMPRRVSSTRMSSRTLRNSLSPPTGVRRWT
jgi:hypothetical protein